MDTVQKLFRFLDESPTCYHAAANAKAALMAAGAVELRESEQWKLEKGTLYVVERGDSALVAFRVPEGPFHGFLMAAAHSDSPTFKVRETAEAASAGNTLRLSVEPYGGGPVASAGLRKGAGGLPKAHRRSGWGAVCGVAGWTGPCLWRAGW